MKKRWVMAASACALAVSTVPILLSNQGGGADVGLDEAPAGAVCSGEGAAKFDFTLKDPDGGAVKLADYKGKVVLLNFWGTWCPPCRMEIPGFIELQDSYRDKGLVIVGVAVEDTPEAVKAYAAEAKINYPLAMVQDDIDAAYGPMYGLPVSFIIARDGSICRRHLGELSKERAEQEIKALL
jgi:thiol-disulfide isomerase/thioredoxin